jgi:hypothetical protein
MNPGATQPVEYQVEETGRGTWRRFAYPDGRRFEEYASRRKVFGLPLLHITRGKNPETGKPVMARGVVAIGQFARGVVAIGQFARGGVAIGQFAVGVISIGQLALGLLFGLGQAATGVVAVGQLAVAGLFALGQSANGYVAIGQDGFGWYVLAQSGSGKLVWDMSGAAPEAVEFFRSWLPR